MAAKTTRPNVPAQKSSSSRKPNLKKAMTQALQMMSTAKTALTAFSRFHLNSSSRKAMAGWVMATDEVMPAMKSREEEHAAEDLAERDLLEDDRQGLEAEVESASLGDGLGLGQAEEDGRRGNHNGPAKNDLDEFVERAGRKAVERDVVVFVRR